MNKKNKMIKKTYLRKGNEFLILVNDARPELNICRRYVQSYTYHGCTRSEDYFTFESAEAGNKYYFQMLDKGFNLISEKEYEEVEMNFNNFAY